MGLDKNLIDKTCENVVRYFQAYPDMSSDISVVCFFQVFWPAIQELKKVQFNFQIGECFVRQATIMDSPQNPYPNNPEYALSSHVVGFEKNFVFVEPLHHLVVLHDFWKSVEESKKIKPNLRGI
jgi:hypothetical protein